VSIERGRELRAEIETALVSAAIDDVEVTLDPSELESLVNGSNVLLITPPDMEFPTYTTTKGEWELQLIITDREVVPAWESASRIIDALKDPLNLEKARATPFAISSNGVPYPGYTLTFNEIF
jgi:hypothetical protein